MVPTVGLPLATPSTDQATAMSLVPETVAVMLTVPRGSTVAEAGALVTKIVGLSPVAGVVGAVAVPPPPQPFSRPSAPKAKPSAAVQTRFSQDWA